jgi:hypothetical protein
MIYLKHINFKVIKIYNMIVYLLLTLDIRRGLIGFATGDAGSEGIIPKARTFTLRGDAARLGDLERVLDFDFLGLFDRDAVLRLGLLERLGDLERVLDLEDFLGVIASIVSATAAPTIIPGAGRGAIIDTTSGFWSIPSITAFATGFLETRLGDFDRVARLGDFERLGDFDREVVLRLETRGDIAPAVIFTGRVTTETVALVTDILRLGDFEVLRLGLFEVLRLGDLERLGLLERVARLGDLEREGIFILVYK